MSVYSLSLTLQVSSHTQVNSVLLHRVHCDRADGKTDSMKLDIIEFLYLPSNNIKIHSVVSCKLTCNYEG